MRSAALVATRPQPDVVGQEERDAALALARKDQQRFAVGPIHHVGALGGARIDRTEPAAPVWRIFVGSLKPAGHRMALAEIGELGAEWQVGGASAWLGRQHALERCAPEACWARIVRPGGDQNRAARAHIARDVV